MTMVIGAFKERSKGHDFQFRKTEDQWAIDLGYPYEVCCGDSEIRYARIHKTVAYIMVDEDEYGDPVIEKWSIKMYNWSTL